MMRVALGQFKELTTERLTFAKQLGVTGVQLNTPMLPDETGVWELPDLKRMRERVESFGLQLEALENVPQYFLDKVHLGLPGRDEQIEKLQQTIRNMGAAGIPILGYGWMPNWVWRTPNQIGRGGAVVTAFDLNRVEEELIMGVRTVAALEGREVSEAEMWDNYAYFCKAILPVCEEAGVKLALHPDDPPLPSLGGIARLFHTFENFRKAMEEVGPSPNHGLEFCVGCFSEMGPDVIQAVRYFGERGRIFYVHLRDVQGCVPTFQECFLGEGNVDVVAVVRTLAEVGFDGFIIDDHVPHMIDDSDWNHRGHAHATGYILGVVEAVSKLCV